MSATGESVLNKCLTHGLSFPGSYSGKSENSIILKEKLETCMFRHALLRIIRKVVHLRQNYTDKILWIRKEDAKSAYRQFHMNADTAILAGVHLQINGEDYLLLSLRLPFVVSPCPIELCLFSDIITDSINDLMAWKNWNPAELASDYVHKIPSRSNYQVTFRPLKQKK